MTKALSDRLANADRTLTAAEHLRDERAREVKRLDKEVVTLQESVELLDKVEQTLQAVSSRILGKSTDVIDKLVTAGLKAVFYDQKLEFKTVVDKYRGKTSIKFELYDNGQTAPLMSAFGGGVVVVVGVLLRIVTIIVLGQRRLLFLDESLAHLSEEYHENASALLKKLCEKEGFTILMVSHQEGFVQHADKHYRAKKGKDGTTFEVVTNARQAAAAG